MTCTRPVKLDETFIVPCGRCIACRIAHAHEWAARMVQEASCHEYNSFITLTYDDDCLPDDRGLRQEDFTLFLKLLRYHYGDKKIKYYGCGEYGGMNGRPHYHIITFGFNPKDRDLIDKVWKKGRTQCGTVTYESAKYCANYVLKMNTFNWKELGLQKPFQRCLS